jgi:transcriptional regulator with XRE-family HTH domain
MVDIKKKIKEHGWTLEKVGKEIGVTKSGMTQAVSGNPTIKTLEAIAGVLGISVSELLRDDDSRATEFSCPHCGKPIHVKLEKGGSE